MAPLFKSCLFLALLAPVAGIAQIYPAFTIADSLKANASEVVREESFQFVASSDKEGSEIYRKAVTLLNKDSDAATVLVHYDGDTKVKRFEARIYDALGREVRKVDKNEIRDYAALDGYSIYQDDRYKVLEVNYSQYPYTLVYEYEIALKGLQFAVFPAWGIQGYNQSVEKALFSVSLPSDITLNYQVLNIALEPRVEEGKDQTTYTWEVSGLKAIEKEPVSPSFYEDLPMVLTSPGRFAIGKYQGSMSSWKDYGAFVNRLYEGRDVLPPAVAAEVHAMAADAVTNAEKIERLYRYLQHNMRYVSVQLGIGGWQPFDAAYVAENKYGDCKALTNFMKALLKEAGITAYPALIAPGASFYEVQEDFTTPRFSHVILYVPEQDTWLECTSTHMPTGYIGEGNSNRNVLLITEEGGRLARTPELIPEDNRAIGRTEISVAADGSATARAVLKTTGSEHETYRYAGSELSREELGKWFTRQSSLPSFKLESLEIQPEPDSPEATVEWAGSMPRYASRAGKRLFLPLNLVNTMIEVPKKMDKRRLPVAGRSSFIHRDTIVLHLPGGFQVESLPEAAVELEADYASYRAEAVLDSEKGTVTYTRYFQVHPFRLPPGQYDAFRNFMAQVAKADKTMVVLVEKKT